jgi:alanine transaminase
MGECGLRGGYTEVINLERDVRAMLFKSISAMLCPTVLGQVCNNNNVKTSNIDRNLN